MGLVDSFQMFVEGLDIEKVKLLGNVLAIMFIGLTILLFNALHKSQEINQRYKEVAERNRKAIIKKMGKSKNKSFNYNELDSYINRKGVGYMTKYKLTPIGFIYVRVLASIFWFIVGLQVNFFVGLLLAPIGYYGLIYIINESDKADNKAMLEDIKGIYDTLRIQTKAGNYITNILVDCYLFVQNKRLKSALLDLTKDITANKDIDITLDKFRGKFDNEYIDTLVLIIKQSMKTGQAAQIFEDIRKRISDIEGAMVLNEQAKIKAKILTVQVILYLAIILVSIFISIKGLSAGINF